MEGAMSMQVVQVNFLLAKLNRPLNKAYPGLSLGDPESAHARDRAVLRLLRGRRGSNAPLQLQ